MLKPPKPLSPPSPPTPLTKNEEKEPKRFPYIQVGQVAGSVCTVTLMGESLSLRVKESGSLDECVAFARELSKLTEMPAFGSRTTFTTAAVQEVFNVN